MDANPAFPLLLMYRSDPIYSLCASDLMTASRRVNNDFIKDQKQLVKTLKKLEHQKVTRLRQLNEEKKQFAFLMRKRLSPRSVGLATASVNSLVRAENSLPSELSSTSHFSATVGSSGVHSYIRHPQQSQPLHMEGQDQQKLFGFNEYSSSKTYVCQCGRWSKWLTRSEGCLPVTQQHVAMGGASAEFNGHSSAFRKPVVK